MIPYEEYLARERQTLAARIHGADLLTIDRFVPNGPESFHDARFESLSVATSVTGHGGSATHGLRVELCLKGPYFDRYYELHYEDVSSFDLQAPGPEDDLLMHEVQIERDVLVHEFLFDKGKTTVIMCRELRFIERVENADGAAP
jgi:hypothetical protein